VRQLQVQTFVPVGQYLLQQSSSLLQLVLTTLHTPPELPPLLVDPPLLAPPVVLPPVDALPVVPLEVEPLPLVPVELVPLLLEPPLELPLVEPRVPVLPPLEPPLDEPPTEKHCFWGPPSPSSQIAPLQQSVAKTQGQGGAPLPGLHWHVLGPPS
jgi:hypothetical protein